jgi:short-subunit dehydrogenase
MIMATTDQRPSAGIVAADDARIADVATELQGLDANAEAVQVDVATSERDEALYGSLRGRSVDAIALKAAIGAGGAFATDTDLQQQLKLLDLNVRSTVHLVKRVVADMVARNERRASTKLQGRGTA